MLKQTEEHVNGKVTSRYGDTFILGNNSELDSGSSLSDSFIRFSYPNESRNLKLDPDHALAQVLYISAAEALLVAEVLGLK